MTKSQGNPNNQTPNSKITREDLSFGFLPLGFESLFGAWVLGFEILFFP